MSSETAPELKIVGYCRTCGKALDEASVRQAHGTIFCEEHVPAGPPPIDMQPSPTQQGTYNPPPSGSSYSSPYAGQAPPPIPDQGASPGLAFVLGLIPGVGAIYNGQYAKGLVHVLILGLLFTIVSSDAANGMEPILGLMIPCFWVYMAFEAYHTAQKRRLGQRVEEFSGLAQAGAASRFPVTAVLLMVFGIIFLLNNLGLLQISRIIRYWPVLMIAAGAYLLWTRMSGAQQDNGSKQQ